MFFTVHLDASLSEKRQRRGSNPRGQSPLDFKSNSLTSRTHCLTGNTLRVIPVSLRDSRRAICGHDLSCCEKGLWRNGSASDSRSDGWAFESLWPQFYNLPQILPLRPYWIFAALSTTVFH